jgi:hypothetical protein
VRPPECCDLIKRAPGRAAKSSGWNGNGSLDFVFISLNWHDFTTVAALDFKRKKAPVLPKPQ